MTRWISDVQIGKNLARHRSEARLSQKELAEKVRACDPVRFKWSAATVWNIEDGTRPLRLGEAEVVAQLLKCTVEDLLSNVDTNLSKSLLKLMNDTYDADLIEKSTLNLVGRIIQMGVEADQLLKAGTALTDEDDLQLRAVIEQRTPLHIALEAFQTAMALKNGEEPLLPGKYVDIVLRQLQIEAQALEPVVAKVMEHWQPQRAEPIY